MARVCACDNMIFRAEMERKKQAKNSKPHIKKPLNAFMLYMKEQRAKVVSECTLKESAAINQILGRKVSQSKMSIALECSGTLLSSSVVIRGTIVDRLNNYDIRQIFPFHFSLTLCHLMSF